jgi:hypothetical protein
MYLAYLEHSSLIGVFSIVGYDGELVSHQDC